MRTQFPRRVALLLVLLGLSSLAAADSVAAERAWVDGAEALVAAARSHAEASRFQQDVQAHRERLRHIVRLAGPTPPPARRELHTAMILLNALLKSASDCHRGGRIVCPADLMRQLEAQVQTVRARLQALENEQRVHAPGGSDG